MSRNVALIMAGGTGGHVFPALATVRVGDDEAALRRGNFREFRGYPRLSRAYAYSDCLPVRSRERAYA